jgi:hypothetical protein
MPVITLSWSVYLLLVCLINVVNRFDRGAELGQVRTGKGILCQISYLALFVPLIEYTISMSSGEGLYTQYSERVCASAGQNRLTLPRSGQTTSLQTAVEG